MRPKAGARARSGFATWIRLNAADEVIAENELIWDTLDDVAKGEMINKRAAELQKDYNERIKRGGGGC